MKVWIVYEEVAAGKGKPGHHIHKIFDSKQNAFEFRDGMMKEGYQRKGECFDLEAFDVQ